MHSYKMKSIILDTVIIHIEHIDFTLEAQMGKPTFKGCSISIFNNCRVIMHAHGSLG